MLRSSATASRLASAEAPLPAGLATAGAAVRRATILPARFVTDRLTGLAARLGDDIKVISLLQRFVLLQFQLAIGDAFAGRHVVFHAVPGADEVHFVFGEEEPHRSLVGPRSEERRVGKECRC